MAVPFSRSDVDAALIAALIAEPRSTHRRLADVTGLPESTVRGRVKRLFDGGQVTTSLFVHPVVEETSLIYQLRVVLDEALTLAGLLENVVFADSPWIAQVATTGEVVVQFAAPDFDAIRERIVTVGRLHGVESIECVVVLSVYVGAHWEAPGDERSWPRVPRRSADEVDRALITALLRNGRLSYTDLAPVAGLTVAGVRRRVLRLVEDGLVRFATRVESDKFSFHEAAVDLVVAPSGAASLIDDISSIREVRYVIEQSGPFNLSTYVVAPTMHELTGAVAEIEQDARVLRSRVEPFHVQRDRVSWSGRNAL